MAKKSSKFRNMTRLPQPAITKLQFELESGTNYISIPAALSLYNRRMYRQGMNYYVQNVEVSTSAASTAQLDWSITKIPHTWVSEKSWLKAKSLWERQQRTVLRESGISSKSLGKWRDFTIAFDATNAANQDTVLKDGVTGNWLLPKDAGWNDLSTVGSAVTLSEVVQPASSGTTDETYSLHMIAGDSTTNNGLIDTDGSFAIIQGYADTRVSVNALAPELPSDASDSWMVEMFDDGAQIHDEVMDIIETHGERPPYAHAANVQSGSDPIYPGGTETMDMGALASYRRSNTLGGTLELEGGVFFGGLMKVQAPVDCKFIVNLVPGHYRGVAATQIGDAFV